ncbi:CaiB/BaiF CoA transferase family protein [Paraburkholderia phymatum]|uniref:CaiB/BaiF CoA transferase family protein n=1 Tax=Paraburkholderia phymatum TaxID=148447 RepID=A0ACC6UCU7_9BURK
MSVETQCGPLAGVRILDLSSIVLGPLATLTLAGLGAEVIKIEAPEGDNVREAGSMRVDAHGEEHEKMGHVFMHNNRGKKSVVLDLKKASARQALLKLAKDADVLLSNIRPAAMDRLGLGYEALAAVNPRLVYVTACGYSARGPYADRPAYDDLIQGATGLPWLMQQYGTGQPMYAPVSLADRVTGLHVAYSISAALFARERNGCGQHIEVSMFESVAHFVLTDHMAGRTFAPGAHGERVSTGEAGEGEVGYDRLLSADRRPYQTADGYLCVLIYNDKHWRALMTSIGKPELFDDPLFSTQRNRSRRIREVYAWVAGVMRTRTTAQWKALLDQADIPYQAVNSIEDLLNDPHLNATGFIGEALHPTEGRVRTLGNPTTWSGTPLPSLSPTPRLGEHSVAVLLSAGYSHEEVKQLLDEGAACAPRDTSHAGTATAAGA